jgi:hypothetical protein
MKRVALVLVAAAALSGVGYAETFDDLVEVESVQVSAGDTDLDNDVDLLDLNGFSDGWYGNLPPSWATGDFDGDNDVDVDDRDAFSEGWYGPSGPGGEHTTPEPSALVMLTLGAACVVALRRKRT